MPKPKHENLQVNNILSAYGGPLKFELPESSTEPSYQALPEPGSVNAKSSKDVNKGTIVAVESVFSKRSSKKNSKSTLHTAKFASIETVPTPPNYSQFSIYTFGSKKSALNTAQEQSTHSI